MVGDDPLVLLAVALSVPLVAYAALKAFEPLRLIFLGPPPSRGVATAASAPRQQQ